MALNEFENRERCPFQYMNEDAIDSELICSICTEPFVDPGTMWSCDHIFCRRCIEAMLHSSRLCPICRNSQIFPVFQKATRNLVNMLNKIPVRCVYCNMVDIAREDFMNHIGKLCLKVIVHCPASDNSCIWSGPRDQFSSHSIRCIADLKTSYLNPCAVLTKEMKELESTLNRLISNRQQLVSYSKFVSDTTCIENRCELLENNNQQLEKQLSELNQQIKLIKEKVYSVRIVTPLSLRRIHPNANWKQDGCIVAGGSSQGTQMNQLRNPYGFYIDDGRTLYIADSSNHRIVKWRCDAKSGQVVAGGNRMGDRSDQLNCPTDVIVDQRTNSLIICDYTNKRVVQWPLEDGRKGKTIISNIACHGLAIDRDGHLYVTDYENNLVRRYRMGESDGTVVAGGNGKGNGLNQLNGPIYVAVGRDNSVYVSDEQNHRIMKWKEGSQEGIIVAGNHRRGAGLEQLSEPAKVIVDSWHTIYIADWQNNRIIRWLRGATQGHIVIDGNGNGGRSTKLNHPISLAFDRQGNLYVANQWNHQILKFDIVEHLSIG